MMDSKVSGNALEWALVLIAIAVALVIIIGSRITNQVVYDRALSELKSLDATIKSVVDESILEMSKEFADKEFSAKDSMRFLVSQVNRKLSDNRYFYWDSDYKCFISSWKDTHGGNYLLTEYPISKSSDLNLTTKGEGGCVAYSLWSGGFDKDILTSGELSKDAKGVCSIVSTRETNTHFIGFREKDSISPEVLTIKLK